MHAHRHGSATAPPPSAMAPRRVLGRGCWLAAVLAVWPLWIAAAQSPSDEETAGGRNPFLPPPRTLTSLVNGAAKDLQQQRFDEAVAALGAVLAGQAGQEQLADQDYFAADEQGRLLSVRTQAQQLLGQAPPAARRLYELRYGQQARRQLRQAVQERDRSLLAETARRFLHTAAGYEAALLHAQLLLDDGDAWASAAALTRLTRWPAAQERLEPELSLWLAAALWASGESERAVEVVWRRREALRRSSVSPPPLANRDAARRWLEQWAALSVTGPPRPVEWTMHRGNPQRNADTAGGFPAVRPRWRVRLHDQPSQADLAAALHDVFRREGLAAAPAAQPLAVRNLVLARTPAELVAVDLSTGKRVWRYPPWSGEELADKLSQWAPAPDPASQRSANTSRLTSRVWADASLGQISSDGESVFVLQPEEPHPNNLPIVGRSRLTRRSVTLAALDLRTQGRVRWVAGGEQLVPSELTGAHFLGAPLAAGGRLYSIYELDGELRLGVLDPQSGELLWRQQLAHMEDKLIDRDGFRRQAGASPSLAGGVLICPTAAGVVVAVDPQQRSLLWAYRYPTYREAAVTSASKYSQPGPRQPYWIDGVATVSGEQVLLTPPESEELHCLNLFDGDVRWVRPRENLLYVASVTNDVVVLVGNDDVQAFRAADGEPAWSQPLQLDGQPTGRGFRDGGHYYLPLSNQEIWKIDLAGGTLVERQPAPAGLGNLICYKDQLISVGHEHLQAFHLREPLRERLAATLAADSNDRWARRRQAELWMEQQRLPEAVAALRQLVAGDLDDIESRALYVDACLLWMEGDYAAGAPVAAAASEFFVRDDQLRYWKLVLEGERRAGRLERAVHAARQLADRMDPAAAQDLLPLDPPRRVAPQRWLASQVSLLWSLIVDPASNVEPSQRSAAKRALDDWFAAEWRLARERDAIDRWRRLIEVFDAAPQSALARLQLADRQQQRGNLLEAEWLVLGLEESADPEIAVSAWAALGEIWAEAGRGIPAWRAVAMLEGPCRDWEDGEGVSATDRALQLRRRIGPDWPSDVASAANDPPTGEVRAVRTSEAGLSYSKRSYPILNRHHGSTAEVFREAYSLVLERPSSLVLRDRFGRPLLRFGMASSVRSDAYLMWRMGWHGHLIAAAALSPSSNCELVAVNALTQPDDLAGVELWRQPLTDPIPGQVSRRRTTQVLESPLGLRRHVPTDSDGQLLASLGPQSRRGVVFRRGVELVCCHPLSGELLWRRDDVDPGSALLGDEELVVAAPAAGGVARCFRVEDGAETAPLETPPLDALLAWHGLMTLSYSQDADGVELSARDLRDAAPRWKQRWSAAAQACLVDDDRVVISDLDGATVMLSLSSGEPQWRARLTGMSDLKSVRAIPSAQGCLLIRNSEREAEAAEREFSRAPSVAHSELTVGDIWFLGDQGQQRWASPVRVEQYAIPVDQAPDLPVLLLMRNERQGRTASSSLVLLNKLDGSLAAEIFTEGKSISSYRAQWSPELGELSLETTTGEYAVRWSSGDRPPRPPAWLRLSRSSQGPKLGEVTAKLLQSAAEQLALPRDRNPFGPRN